MKKFTCPNCGKILDTWFQVHNCVAHPELQRAAKGPLFYRGPRCGLCYWALYDGDWCQNPECVMHGKSVHDDRIYLTNEEAAILIAGNNDKSRLDYLENWLEKVDFNAFSSVRDAIDASMKGGQDGSGPRKV